LNTVHGSASAAQMLAEAAAAEAAAAEALARKQAGMEVEVGGRGIWEGQVSIQPPQSHSFLSLPKFEPTRQANCVPFV
jgi:hypothetical protein